MPTGDLAMMADATAAGTSDVTYDLDGDGSPADEADLTLLKEVSVGGGAGVGGGGHFFSFSHMLRNAGFKDLVNQRFKYCSVFTYLLSWQK